jgi:sulfate adenylyltransferase subunit 1 (EFTu-like GTPase family)
VLLYGRFRPYAENREMGGFILIDRLSNAMVGAGMLQFVLRCAHLRERGLLAG